MYQSAHRPAVWQRELITSSGHPFPPEHQRLASEAPRVAAGRPDLAAPTQIPPDIRVRSKLGKYQPQCFPVQSAPVERGVVLAVHVPVLCIESVLKRKGCPGSVGD